MREQPIDEYEPPLAIQTARMINSWIRAYSARPLEQIQFLECNPLPSNLERMVLDCRNADSRITNHDNPHPHQAYLYSALLPGYYDLMKKRYHLHDFRPGKQVVFDTAVQPHYIPVKQKPTKKKSTVR
jgi:hypothetical protein